LISALAGPDIRAKPRHNAKKGMLRLKVDIVDL
jgi:hypothetical protein